MQQHHQIDSSILSSASSSARSSEIIITSDDLIAEAFLRCARMRTCCVVWRSKSRDRARRYQVAIHVADVFRQKYLAWNVLQQWRKEVDERSRLSSMSIVAWGWQARRSKRRVLAAWRAYCDQIAIRRERTREALSSIKYDADARLQSSCYFSWLGFASRCQAADAFVAFRTNKALQRSSLRTWRRRLLKKRTEHVQVDFLRSRIVLQNQRKTFDSWFLDSFASKKKQVLDYRAAMEQFATHCYLRNVLLRRCFSAKWVPATRRRIAERFHRRATLKRCLVSLFAPKFAQHRDLRLRLEYFHHEIRSKKQVCDVFHRWSRRSQLQRIFVKLDNRKKLTTKRACFRRWTNKLRQNREETRWKLIGGQVRRNFVLKRGFESLLQCASKICAFNHQHHLFQHQQQQPDLYSTVNHYHDHHLHHQRYHRDPHKLNNDNKRDSNRVTHNLSQDEVESTIRSLLSSFRHLMLTHPADQQILLDNAIADTSSVKLGATSRNNERQRLRALILQLRESLSRRVEEVSPESV